MLSGSGCGLGEGKNNLKFEPCRFRARQAETGGCEKGEGGGVTLADSRICPVSGQATCFLQPTGSAL